MTELKYAIGYARVSTPKQAAGEGLVDQEKAIRSLMEHEGLTPFPENFIFHEPYTGSEESRPVYTQILKLIDSNKGKIKYLVIKVIDRFSRGGASVYQKMKNELDARGVILKDCSGVIQAPINSLAHYNVGSYEWSRQSPSQTSEIVMAEEAKNERGRILTRLIGPQIGLVQQGYRMRRPPDGYKNIQIMVNSRKKNTLEADSDRAKFFIEMFRLRAENIYSDKEIVKAINNMGFRSKVQNRWDKNKTNIIGQSRTIKLTIKQLQVYITKLVYAGIACERWTNYLPIKGKWDGLVSIDIFNKANRGKIFIKEHEDGTFSLLRNIKQNPHSKRRNKFRQDFLFKNIVLCSVCKKPLHGSVPKNKRKNNYEYYHCSRNHKYFGVSKSELETNFNKYLSKIKFRQKFFDSFEKVLVFKYRQEEGNFALKTSEANRNIADLETKKAQLIKSFPLAISKTLQEGIETQIIEIQTDIEKGKDYRNSLEIEEKDIHDFIDFSKKLLEHPQKILENIGNIEEQRGLFGLFFERFPTYDEILNGTPKLTLVFKLNDEFDTSESSLLTLQRIEL